MSGTQLGKDKSAALPKFYYSHVSSLYITRMDCSLRQTAVIDLTSIIVSLLSTPLNS